MPLKQMLTMESNRKEDDPSSKTTVTLHRKGPNFAKKKDKFFARKRSQSFSGLNSKFCPPYKYRTRPMLPTKFLLGGNICDPLNLNSLQDEEVNRTVNAITPKSSPIPTPPQRRGHIEVIIPPNIHDPLNLIDCADDAEYEQQLTSPLKKGNKRRKKKKRTSSATTEPSDADISASEAQTPDLSNDSAKIPDLEVTSSTAEDAAAKEKLSRVTRELKLELTPVKEKKRKSDSHKEGVKKLRRLDSMDKIVSPVVPQPGAWLKRALQFNRNAGPSNRGHTSRPSGLKTKENGKVPRFRDKNKAYQYGNYNRYYGYRNPNHEVDSRLRCFAAHRHIFEGRDILDIGCNIGHITLSIARDFGAKSVVGIDIDKKLIGIARKNVRHYVNCNDSPRDEPSGSDKNDKCFPISMPILYGPVDVPGMQNDEVRGRGFPHNVTFVQGNYVLEDDSLLCTEQPQFDVILCLSITKWLHLNWGDQGLKQAFRRMYAQLKPGGRLILEPQSWASYKHKKTLTETIYKHYNSIEFFPEKFTQYLLSSEVGFAKSEIMGQPHHPAKGFQRPIQVFTRSNLSPSQSQRSYSITPSHTVTSGGCTTGGGAGKQVYTCLPSPDVCTDDAASARVDPGTTERSCDGVVRSKRQLEPGRDATGVGRSARREETHGRSDSSRDKGTRKENKEDQPVRSEGNADGTENQSSTAAGMEENGNKIAERVNSEQDKRETGGRVADKDEEVRLIVEKQEAGCKIVDKQAASGDHQAANGDHQAANGDHQAKVADHQAKVADQAASADHQAISADHQAALADLQAALADHQAKVADHQAVNADNQAALADHQAALADHQAVNADHQAAITDHQAKATDHQAAMADNQAKVTDNPAAMTDHQAKVTEQTTSTLKPATNTLKQAKTTDHPAKSTRQTKMTDKLTDNQATITDNQAKVTQKSTNSLDNPTRSTSSPVHPTKSTSSPDIPTKSTYSPDNPPKSTYSPIHPTKSSYTPENPPTTPTNAPITPLTPAPGTDNQQSRPTSPHNRVPTSTSATSNDKCNNPNAFRDNNAINPPNNVRSHLESATSATHGPCGGARIKKRKHTAPANVNSESTPAKRQFVSPVKRKPDSLAVKRTYTGNVTHTKRKNDQSTTDSTLTTADSTLTRDNEAEMRLDDMLANQEAITTDQSTTTGKSTTGKSTTAKSTQYRVMQKTKCIMDNT